jgi:hypothetical protein
MGKPIAAVLVGGLPAADINNAKRVNLWVLLWAGTLITRILMQDAGVFGLMDPSSSLTATVINLVVGIIVYRRTLLTVDEMERAIGYGALTLAVAFLVYGASLILPKTTLVPALDASAMIAIMTLTYCCGLIVGRLRMA